MGEPRRRPWGPRTKQGGLLLDTAGLTGLSLPRPLVKRVPTGDRNKAGSSVERP